MFYIREYMGISYFARQSELGIRKYRENEEQLHVCVNPQYHRLVMLLIVIGWLK